jgi:hypothetical protein
MEMTRSDRFKHALICLAAILALTCIWHSAHAATGSTAVNYTPPTQYEDGTPLPASDIKGYAVDCKFTPTGGSTASVCTLDTTTLPGGTARTGTVKITYPVTGGTACFVLKTMTVAAQSDGSQPPACQVLPAVQPNDPTNLTITITLTLNIASDTPIRVAVAEPVISKVSP